MPLLTFRAVLVSTLLLAFTGAGTAFADGNPPAEGQPEEKNPFADIKFVEGPVDGKLEDVAMVKVPEGTAFIGGKAECAKFVEATQNLVTGQEMGIIVPNGAGEQWWIEFDFNPIGFVKDDEKGKLDADAILDSLRKGQEEANGDRKRRGWPALHITGWHTPPRYNPTSHNLEWATKLQADGSTREDVNYNVRVLGRRGVMSVTLIAMPEFFDKTLPRLQAILADFKYNPEQTYASYKSGDKIAEYGLTALVVGGTLAVAAKTGLQAKFWKVIVAAIAALGAGIRKLFGGKKKADPNQPPPYVPPQPPGV